MARGGIVDVTVHYAGVERMLNAVLRNVERGTKKATLAACQVIFDRSQELVPKDTTTLMNSGFIHIAGKYRGFIGVVGYGGNGDPVNPSTGRRASQYMIEVHEDLTVHHVNGTAKFLEIAVQEQQQAALLQAAKSLRGTIGR